MSSLALMRWLESAPDRYDAGMRWLTLGRLDALHDALAEAVTQRAAAPRPRAVSGLAILEIGCGTGAVTARLVARGARVTALDQNPEMIEQARQRVDGEMVTWLERTASEIDALPRGSFDAVVASLSLSEMSASERAFVLRAARELLRPAGVLAVADEVLPVTAFQRLLFRALRAPQAVLGWLLAGSLSRPIRSLSGEIEAAGFAPRRERRWLLGSLALIVAEPRA